LIWRWFEGVRKGVYRGWDGEMALVVDEEEEDVF
jgi:hypothetical protein